MKYLFLLILTVLTLGCTTEQNVIVNTGGQLLKEGFQEIQDNKIKFKLNTKNNEIYEVVLIEKNTNKTIKCNYDESTGEYYANVSKGDIGTYIISIVGNENVIIEEGKEIEYDLIEKQTDDGKIIVVQAVKMNSELVVKNIEEVKIDNLYIKINNIKLTQDYYIKLLKENTLITEAALIMNMEERTAELSLNLEKFELGEYSYKIIEKDVLEKDFFAGIINLVKIDDEVKIQPSNILSFKIEENSSDKVETNGIAYRITKEDITLKKYFDINIKSSTSDITVKNTSLEDEYGIFSIEVLKDSTIKNFDLEFTIKPKETKLLNIYFNEEDTKPEIKIKKQFTITNIGTEKKLQSKESLVNNELLLMNERNSDDYSIHKYYFELINESTNLNIENKENVRLFLVNDNANEKITKIQEIIDQNIEFEKSNPKIMLISILPKNKTKFPISFKLFNKGNLTYYNQKENIDLVSLKSLSDYDEKPYPVDFEKSNEKILDFQIKEMKKGSSYFYKLINTTPEKNYDRRIFIMIKKPGIGSFGEEYNIIKVFNSKNINETIDNEYNPNNSFYLSKKEFSNTTIDKVYIGVAEVKGIIIEGKRTNLSPQIYQVSLDTEENFKKLENREISEVINEYFENKIMNNKKIDFIEYYRDINQQNFIYLDGRIYIKNLNSEKMNGIYSAYEGVNNQIKEVFWTFKLGQNENEDTEFKGLIKNYDSLKYNESGKRYLKQDLDNNIYISLPEIVFPTATEGEVTNKSYLNLNKQNLGFNISGTLLRKINPEIAEEAFTTEMPLYVKKKISSNQWVFVKDSDIEFQDAVNSVPRNLSFNIDEILYIVPEKNIYSIASDLTFYLGMGVMDRYDSEGNKIFNEGNPEEFSKINFSIPSAYTEIYQEYNELYNGAKTKNMRIKYDEVASGNGNFGQNFTETKLEKKKRVRTNNPDWSNINTWIGATTLIADGVWVYNQCKDLHNGTFAMPAIVDFIIKQIGRLEPNKTNKSISVSAYNPTRDLSFGDFSPTPSNNQKKWTTGNIMNWLTFGLNIYTVLNYEDMFKYEDIIWYYTDSEKSWVNIFGGSDNYNLKANLTDETINGIYKLTPEQRINLINKMLNPNDVNYCNVWEMYIYVGGIYDEIGYLKEYYQIGDILPPVAAQAPGDVKIRLLQEIQDTEGNKIFGIGYENSSAVSETDFLPELTSLEYNSFKQGSYETRLKRGWYKLRVKAEKIGTSDIKDVTPWGIVMPINANVFNSELGSKFNIPNVGYFNSEYVSKRIDINMINASGVELKDILLD